MVLLILLNNFAFEKICTFDQLKTKQPNLNSEP